MSTYVVRITLPFESYPSRYAVFHSTSETLFSPAFGEEEELAAEMFALEYCQEAHLLRDYTEEGQQRLATHLRAFLEAEFPTHQETCARLPEAWRAELAGCYYVDDECSAEVAAGLDVDDLLQWYRNGDRRSATPQRWACEGLRRAPRAPADPLSRSPPASAQMGAAMARGSRGSTHPVEDCPMIDLTQLSDEEINREYWRRVHARRVSSGRPKKMQACPSCGLEFATAELRKHRPFCHTLTKAQALEAARKLMVIARSGWQWSVTSASGCLPPGWSVSRQAEDSDFQPCTIKQFTAAFRAYARPTPRGDRAD